MTRDSLRRAATAQAATPEERAADERLRFITANAELAHLTVRQGYSLRVLRGAALALVGAVDRSDAAEGAAAHDDTGASAAEHGAAGVAWTEALAALRVALDDSEEAAKAAETAHQQLVAERDRLRAILTSPADLATSLEGLRVLASRAYRRITLPSDVDAAKHLAEPIRPGFDADNDEAPHLVLALDLGGMAHEGEAPKPWQASVQYDGGMGAVPLIAGNACATPIEAMDSLRAELEAEEQKPLRDDEEGATP